LFFQFQKKRNNNTFTQNFTDMKLYSFHRFFLFIFSLAIVFPWLVSCSKDEITDDDESTGISEDTLLINEWIYDNMKEVYLWSNKISSSINYKKESDPAGLYEKMLYTDEDRWSWITDDWSSYKAELEGTPVSMGFSPAFYYKNSESTDVVTIVEYVYKNSPAEEAGLKRGDIILTYNGETPDDGNYYDLYSGDSYTVGLGTYSSDDGTFVSNGKSIDLTAVSFYANPVLHYEIKEMEGHTIGYLVYTDFTTGVNDAFLDSVDVAMDYFKENSVTDVIIDLRYNPGGELTAAAHIASSLAPQSVVSAKKVLVKMTYNSNVQDYFEQKDDDSNLNCRFAENSSNLNLSKIYFLTTQGTASASELLMVGLKPYMDVVMVGDTTYGKYAGAWVLPDADDEDWCMLPIVFRYSNASGYTNFKDGLAPDVYTHDYLIPAYEFGDLNDAVLAAAIEQITGVEITSTKSAVRRTEFRELHPRQMDRRKIVTVPAVTK